MVAVEGDAGQAVRPGRGRLEQGRLLGRGRHRQGGEKALFLFPGQTEVEVETVGCADTCFEHLLDGLPADAAHHLAGQRPDHQRVVAEGGARTPVRPLRREPFGDQCVVGDLLRQEPTVGTDDTGAMGQQVAQSDLVLAFGAELRPVVAHLLVEIQRAVLDEQGHALGRGKDAGQRVPADSGAGPQVHDELTADVGHQLGRVVAALLRRHGGELVPYGLETGGNPALGNDLDRHRFSSGIKRQTPDQARKRSYSRDETWSPPGSPGVDEHARRRTVGR